MADWAMPLPVLSVEVTLFRLNLWQLITSLGKAEEPKNWYYGLTSSQIVSAAVQVVDSAGGKMDIRLAGVLKYSN